jgi:inorganic pyrophosphatase
MLRSVIRKFSRHDLSTIRERTTDTESIFLHDSVQKKKLSYLIDIPLTENNFQTINCVIEVPRGTLAKRQMMTEVEDHPIATDFRKLNGVRVPRYFQMPVLFNYGFLPQTWEGGIIEKEINENLRSDNDPLDVIELSSKPIDSFLPIECVVLGAIGLVDQSEIDWKIILLNKEEAERTNTKTMQDAHCNLGPLLNYIRTFFREYKTHERRRRNFYLRKGEYWNENEAIDIVKQCHEEFHLLRTDPKWEAKARRCYLK